MVPTSTSSVQTPQLTIRSVKSAQWESSDLDLSHCHLLKWTPASLPNSTLKSLPSGSPWPSTPYGMEWTRAPGKTCPKAGAPPLCPGAHPVSLPALPANLWPAGGQCRKQMECHGLEMLAFSMIQCPGISELVYSNQAFVNVHFLLHRLLLTQELSLLTRFQPVLNSNQCGVVGEAGPQQLQPHHGHLHLHLLC